MLKPGTIATKFLAAGTMAAGLAIAVPSVPEASASTGTTMQTDQVLSVGDHGKAVKKLQTQLHNVGEYKKGNIDGIFGPMTKKAVRSFQDDKKKLAVDGIAGPHTLSALNKGKKQVAKKNKPAVKAKETNLASDIIDEAKSLKGTPYQWGGTSPSGFDCSGFLNYVFEKNDVNLPRTVAKIWDDTDHVNKPKKGDLVFFETYKDGPSHAGIYLGNDRFIQAGSSTGVTISNMNNSYWKPRYLGAKTAF